MPGLGPVTAGKIVELRFRKGRLTESDLLDLHYVRKEAVNHLEFGPLGGDSRMVPGSHQDPIYGPGTERAKALSDAAGYFGNVYHSDVIHQNLNPLSPAFVPKGLAQGAGGVFPIGSLQSHSPPQDFGTPTGTQAVGGHYEDLGEP